MKTFATEYNVNNIGQQAVDQLPWGHTIVLDYADTEFVQQPAAQSPWFHIATIMDSLSDNQEQIFYMKNAIEHGWSRNIMQIAATLYKHQGQAITNSTLPSLEELETEHHKI